MCREFQSHDLEPLLSIWRRATSRSLDFLTPEYFEQSEHYVRLYISDLETFVYPIEGEPLGFVTLDNNRIVFLYVSPEHQGTGIGKHLIDYAKSLHPALTLEVHEKNAKAIRFYLQNGFHGEAKQVQEDSFKETQKILSWRI
jgi:putative acetyltransferase